MPFSNEIKWQKAQLSFEYSDASKGYHIEVQREDGQTLWLLNGDKGFHCSEDVGQAIMRFLNGEEVR